MFTSQSSVREESRSTRSVGQTAARRVRWPLCAAQKASHSLSAMRLRAVRHVPGDSI